MSLESIYYLGQTIAVMAILGFLAGILFQMRQTNRLARARASMEEYFASPRGRRWWRRARETYFKPNPEISAQLDAIVADIEAQEAAVTT